MALTQSEYGIFLEKNSFFSVTFSSENLAVSRILLERETNSPSQNPLRTHTRVYNNNLLKNKRYPVQKAGTPALHRLYFGCAASILPCGLFYILPHTMPDEWCVPRPPSLRGLVPKQSRKKLKMKNQKIEQQII
ncbi:MAG: hypothetical protein LBR46_00980 [Prevotella sp.]|jgi:hypothetical protein|nr:hypothetical protein [Prevotella sp.]